MDVQQPLSPHPSLRSPGAKGDDTVPKASKTSSSVPYLRSCLSCRHKKIKCNRQQPCSNCTRTVSDCVYPKAPGRAPKRPRRPLDYQLADRLDRLESIIRQIEKPSDASLEKDMSRHQADAQNSSTSPVEQQLGRLVIDDTKSYYVSNVLWASLGNEIEELRDLLQESPSGDEDDLSTRDKGMYENLGFNAAVFGFRALSHSLRSLHPPLPVSETLYRIFNENVVPVTHIFHMPTLARIYWDAVASLDFLNKDVEALLFSIYYSAAISMPPEQCTTMLGMSRNAAKERYRFAVEQGLARANLLNTRSLILLQAAVLFLSALRNEDESRTTWALTSLLFHIAQSMGLHRDGAAFRLKPLETELRRRLWYGICFLCYQASEYHGCEPIVRCRDFDTKPPLNINDADISAEMTEPPPEKEGFTEMTFSRIRCEAFQSITGRTSGHVPLGAPTGSTAEPDGSNTKGERDAPLHHLRRTLQENYLKYCDPSVPFQHLCITVIEFIIARSWITVHYPHGFSLDRDTSNTSEEDREQLWQNAVKILRMSSENLTNKSMARWTWNSKTYIQWHAVALVFSEICARPPSDEIDRAWEHVCVVYDGWKLYTTTKGALARPITKLMAKARYVREMQKVSSSQSTPASCSATGGNAQAGYSADMSPAAGVNGGISEHAFDPGCSYPGLMGSLLGNTPIENGLRDVVGMQYPDAFFGQFPANTSESSSTDFFDGVPHSLEFPGSGGAFDVWISNGFQDTGSI